jgi:AraC-like DNA-binding protein
VKNATSVKNERLAAWAVTLLRALPGAPVIGEALPGSTDDGSLRFSDTALVLRVEQKAHVDAVVAHSIETGHAVRPEPLLVVARSTTSGAREILEAQGIAYVDAAGNAAIDLPGLHVRTGSLVRSGSFTAGAVIVPAPAAPGLPRLAGKAGLIAQALILEPDRAWTLDAMANRAGVSTALAHRVFSRLERVTVLAADGRGPRKTRRVVSPAALLDLWAEEAVEPKERRTPAYALLRGDGARAVSSRLEEHQLLHAVTGVAAAARHVPFLTSILVTEVRVTAARTPAEVAAATDARLVEDGANIVFVQGPDDAELRFRREVEGVWLAAETRVYLDAYRDPRRGAEQAREYRNQVFGF